TRCLSDWSSDVCSSDLPAAPSTSVRGRNDRDAEVDGAAGQAQLEAAVLWHALLGDVELGHDLDARDDGRVVALVDRIERLVQHKIGRASCRERGEVREV